MQTGWFKNGIMLDSESELALNDGSNFGLELILLVPDLVPIKGFGSNSGTGSS